MEGFYTKKDAANILGVTVRQITNYLKIEKVRKIYHQGKVYIPQEDIEALYDEGKKSNVPRRDEFREALNRIKILEQTIEIIKLGMGFGARRSPRTEAELLVFYQQVLDLLAKPAWPTRVISEIADTIMSLSEEDTKSLCMLKGVKAWAPLIDLSERMILFIEEKEDFPEKGLGALHDRLVRAKNRFLGLIYVSSKVATRLPRTEAREMRKRLEIPPKALDSYIIKYLTDLSDAKSENL
jgi:hypothetical protein